MNAKRVNWLFLLTLIFEAVITVGTVLLRDVIHFNIITSLLISQLVILIPTVVFLLCTRTNAGELIAHNRPKILISFLVIIITFLCMPLIIVANAISLFFVENEVTNLQPLLAQYNPWLILLIIGVIGPVSEEFVFRGVIYHGYRKSGKYISAMILSSVLFGLTHLNFNQMSYAILVGILSVLIMEGTGSIYYSMLFHIVINVTNGVQMLFLNTTSMTQQQREKLIETTMHMTYKQALCVTVALYACIAFVTVSIAGCLYYLILKRENRIEHMHYILSVQKEKGWIRLCSVPLIISVVLCLAYMISSVLLT